MIDFHARHDPMPGPYSPCMHRDDARTVSFTSIAVERGVAVLRYQPGAPCERNESMGVLLCCN
jgi:hypothetical protein